MKVGPYSVIKEKRSQNPVYHMRSRLWMDPHVNSPLPATLTSLFPPQSEYLYTLKSYKSIQWMTVVLNDLPWSLYSGAVTHIEPNQDLDIGGNYYSNANYCSKCQCHQAQPISCVCAILHCAKLDQCTHSIKLILEFSFKSQWLNSCWRTTITTSILTWGSAINSTAFFTQWVYFKVVKGVKWTRFTSIPLAQQTLSHFPSAFQIETSCSVLGYRWQIATLFMLETEQGTQGVHWDLQYKYTRCY